MLTVLTKIMIKVIYIFVGLVSFIISGFCFLMFISSCSGHPPYTQFGIWIIPFSILGSMFFFLFGIIFLKYSHT
jgi:hypothetical protein